MHPAQMRHAMMYYDSRIVLLNTICKHSMPLAAYVRQFSHPVRAWEGNFLKTNGVPSHVARLQKQDQILTRGPSNIPRKH